ncbi:MAG: helix-turn-helix transcriptional regulator [Actinomycetota bacterium]
MAASWSSPGEILRWWRVDVLGLSQQKAAERLSVQPSALSNWERGARAISIDHNQLDELLEGDGALAGLLWSYATPTGMDPVTTWTHVFPGPSTPVWCWVRSPVETISVIGEWGVARMEVELDLEPNGVFFTLGVSVAESPAVVILSEPGWVDFGRGPLPADVPGAEVLSAFDLFRRSSANGTFMELFVGRLASNLTSATSRDLVAFAAMAPRAVASFFSRLSKPKAIDAQQMNWDPLPDHIDEVERLRFARLRRSRGLSLADTIDELVKSTDISISKETLRRFETDVGQPHDRLLPVALDHVLGAGGNLAIMAMRSDRGDGLITFPPFWNGPVWLEVHGPGGERELRLQWGDWYRSVRVTAPALVWFTLSTPEAPVRLSADPDLSWSMGVGRRSGAVSIHQNWTPATIDVAQRALGETEHAFVRAMRQRQSSRNR